MYRSVDPRIESAKARTMREVLDRLAIPDLTALGDERVGPCPRAGCGGTDRFSANVKKGVWRCRICDPKGGDALALVQLALGTDFMGAVEWLEGAQGVEIDPAEVERRQIEKQKADAKAEADAARYRAFAKDQAAVIWRSALPFAGSPAAAYLAARNVDLAGLPYSFACFRYLPAHPYVKKIGRARRELHRGPALISAIQGRDGRFSAVHQTWFNPDAPGQKATIIDRETGEAHPAKMVLGSKKGGAIRLTGTACARVLVMGEGIETTGTALVADAVLGASYWAGVDLGNMSGKQTGRNSGVPDLSDVRAFLPPASVERLIYIQDGDSEEKMTRAKLTAGLRRAMNANPYLRSHIVRAGDGVDLNDLTQGQPENE
ncbi:hypothetical protein SAMN05444149_10890 [Pseudosulfitobacter pseudonitzschiae]|uniref:DUF7146 domain-containing protein n=1 Tax=Pseudosulfitobacter pseudonitzschiae TaxID=1402135 RepID=A0A073IUG2_9RHOB|nr:hypothetical protein [Pseudosulfitobacter pseudonitzschiae]KEJ93973.1 hypothetical protein SUH3_11930 [Pseudosulfitobacter pseudonitzschiae]SHG01345.1 hypothetical protein SAMN05444149_10890 [Pseudosulfitobacter pseudonitzschiae]